MASSRRLGLVLAALVSLLAGCPGPATTPDAGGGSDSGPRTDAGGGTDGGGGGTDAPVVGSAPVAMINHPGDGEDRQVAMDIPMIGVGTDAEDGALPDAALIWTSDVEGAIGTGANFTWAPTMTGPQVITLTVTDSDDNVATDTVTLNITP